MGIASFVLPIIIYRVGGFHKNRRLAIERNQHIHFEDIFPKKHAQDEDYHSSK